MLRNGILQDTFGMLCFLRLIRLHIDGSMLKFLMGNQNHKMLMYKQWQGKGKIIMVIIFFIPAAIALSVLQTPPSFSPA